MVKLISMIVREKSNFNDVQSFRFVTMVIRKIEFFPVI